MTLDSEYWSRYYEVTVERPAWQTVCIAIARFKAEGEAAALHGQERRPHPERLAVDLGCGAGRDESA
jgi:hypothetical protein